MLGTKLGLTGWDKKRKSSGPMDNLNKRGPEQKPKDTASCRARRSGHAHHADCLVEQPFGCQHVLTFGSAFFCLHPERDSIVARTEANWPTPAP